MNWKGTFRDQISVLGENINYAWWVIAAWTRALVTGDKRLLAVLLWLSFSSCDKTIYDLCDYGKWTFDIHQNASSVDRTPQWLVELPFILSAEDIECWTALVKVDVDVYDALTNKFLGSYTQQINDFDWTNKIIYFTMNLPTNCNGVKWDISLSSDEDATSWKENFDLKSSIPFKIDIH
jgi:hypothetical protein